MTTRSVIRAAREVCLTLGALLGVLCILMTLASVALDVTPVVFRSGSMSPAIETGDLAVTRSVAASSLRPGDVVSVRTSTGSRVTHRVVDVAGTGEDRQLTLKGDANRSPDAETYTVGAAQRVVFSVPRVGRAVDAVTSPVGVFVLGLYVAGMLVLAFRRDHGDGPPPSGRPPGGSRRAVRSRRPPVLSRTVTGMVVGTVTMVGTPAVAAPWTNDVLVTGTYAAYTVPRPVLTATSCVVTGSTLNGFTATITWPAVSTPFALTYSARIVESNTVVAVTTSGTNRVVQVTTGLLGSLFGTTVTVRLNAALPSRPTWVSANTDQRLVVGVLGATLTCGTFT